jgi:hypothetical protein
VSRPDPIGFVGLDALDVLEAMEQAAPVPLDAAPDIIGRIDGSLFAAQLAMVKDPRQFRTAVCSRRAGKTIGCAAKLLRSATLRDGAMNLYITRSRKNAKRILWSTLKRMNFDYGMRGIPSEVDLAINFPNGSSIHLAGANDRDAIEDFRGNAMAEVVIDEAQSLPAYLEELIDDVLEPALMDYDGSLTMIGTPGPVPVGYFHKCTQSAEWSHHHWTVFDNPHILKKSGKAPQDHLDRALKRRGVTVEDPRIQREWFGRWVHDPNSLVFRFDAKRNTFHALPQIDAAPWSYVIGVDLGFEDADAIVVLAFNERTPNVYAVEEWVGAKQSITQLAERLGKLIARFSPISIVWDTGGLGLKIADEVTRRTQIPLKAAEKTRKFEFIELLNDALTSGRLLVKPDSRFAVDAMLVEWDHEAIQRSQGERLRVSSRYHSDVADAMLYAYRESLHWLHEPPRAPGPKVGTPEWAAEQEQAMERAALERATRPPEDDAW